MGCLSGEVLGEVGHRLFSSSYLARIGRRRAFEYRGKWEVEVVLGRQGGGLRTQGHIVKCKCIARGKDFCVCVTPMECRVQMFAEIFCCR